MVIFEGVLELIPRKINMEPESFQPWKRNIIFQFTIFRFQPLIFQGDPQYHMVESLTMRWILGRPRQLEPGMRRDPETNPEYYRNILSASIQLCTATAIWSLGFFKGRPPVIYNYLQILAL